MCRIWPTQSAMWWNQAKYSWRDGNSTFWSQRTGARSDKGWSEWSRVQIMKGQKANTHVCNNPIANPAPPLSANTARVSERASAAYPLRGKPGRRLSLSRENSIWALPRAVANNDCRPPLACYSLCAASLCFASSSGGGGARAALIRPPPAVDFAVCT